MKSTFLVLVTLCLMTQLNAQPIQIGVKGGINLPQMTLRSAGVQYTGGDVGFHVGPYAHIQLADNFAFQPGIMFNTKRAVIQNFEFKSINIDLPLNLVFTQQNFFIGAGPNISYGVSGKVKQENLKADMYDKDEAQTLAHKRVDVGINGIMGYHFPGGFSVSTFFTGGISDTYNGTGDVNVTTHSRNFGLSFGYTWPIGKGKK